MYQEPHTGRRTKGEAGDEILLFFKYLAIPTKNFLSREFFVLKFQTRFNLVLNGGFNP